jgi:hypothetical protein
LDDRDGHAANHWIPGRILYVGAKLFGQAEYAVVGVLLILLGIASLVVAAWVGREQAFVLPGLGSAVILWLAGILALVCGRPTSVHHHPGGRPA